MSATKSSAPSAASRRATREPTCPSPMMLMRRPDTSAVPNARASVTPIAARTPWAADRARPQTRPAYGHGAPLRLREAVRVRGALACDQHVLGGRAHILAHAVASAERVDRVAEVEHRRPPPVGGELGVRRERDHALAAPERKPGQRALHRHRLRQCKRVLERLAPVSIAPQAAAPDRLA